MNLETLLSLFHYNIRKIPENLSHIIEFIL